MGFVVNGGWLDAPTMDGFRKSLVNEFSHIYVFNLRGNQRTQDWRREGGKIFGAGSQTSVVIVLLVKTKNKKGDACIHYHDIGTFLRLL